MRIAQITPGVIPIPPNGWGAVEKIIWEYTKVLRSLGHHVEILYSSQVNPGDWDVVHVHMANLALDLKSRGIPYIFSHHDHHAYHYGKNSFTYLENLEAIKGSLVSFVHAKYLVDYFGGGDKIRYLSHGANIEDYIFSDRSSQVKNGEASLLMMANNGLGGDKMYDRKGFKYGIESARKLDLPITIICPSDNASLINAIPKYQKLTTKYDLDYKQSLDEIRKHHVFLNPSMVEAGHPNLTVTEMLSLGIPVVGTSESELMGTVRIPLSKDLTINQDDLTTGISKVIGNYPQFSLECKEIRNSLTWEVIVSKMLMDYTKYCSIDQKDLILSSYSTPIRKDVLSDGKGFDCSFNGSIYVYKSINTPSLVSVSLIDRRTDRIVHKTDFSKSSKSWILYPDSSNEFIDWEVSFKLGDIELFKKSMDLRGEHVLVTGEVSESHLDFLERFEKLTGCILSLEGSGKNKFFGSSGSHDFYYRKLNIIQIIDYFSKKKKISSRTLIKLNSGSLGDNISFIPYVNEYGKKLGEKVDLILAHRNLFEGVYEWINFVNSENLYQYTNYISADYIFERPLQEGMAYQLKLDYEELRPTIPKRISKDIPKGKYVCFSMHSTAQAKHWNSENSWYEMCKELKARGISPVCIDRHESFGTQENWNRMPDNCVNMTGGDLNRMIELISGCEYFIGLSSGLSWLAYALGKRVVMISGVTEPRNEFTIDCLRINHTGVCNSCFNKTKDYEFDPGDWMWCPEFRNTPLQFECTKRISPKKVISEIEKIGW